MMKEKTESRDFSVGGMSCAACAAKVEKAVGAVEGVSSCAVNLLTNSMRIEGNADETAIVSAVEKAGYTASKKNKTNDPARAREDADALNTHEGVLWRRFFSSLAVLLMLMYLTTGHGMLSFPLPPFLADDPIALALMQLLLCAVVMVINGRFFISGFRSLIHRAPNMDALVALGSGASFFWSVVALFQMTAAGNAGDLEQLSRLSGQLYFESAAMILVLITVGKILEARAKGKTTDALKSLMKLKPRTAVVERDGKEFTIDADDLQKGDIFLVRAGDAIPADGVILDGEGAVDESMLTGESLPVEKQEGAQVYCATISRSGFLRCRAEKVAEDTTLSAIIRAVSDASATKAPIARIADRVSGVFVPVVMGIALVTAVIWLLCGAAPAFALERGITVLVISCPCALGLATPVSIMVGSGVGAKNGILFKTASALEETGKTAIAALDKTGTITRGAPAVTDILPAEGVEKEQLLRVAYSLEKKSEHPLALALCDFCDEQGVQLETTASFKTHPGRGVSAMINEKEVRGGSLRFVKEKVRLSERFEKTVSDLAEAGKTPMLFETDGELLGVIAVADAEKPDSREAVEELKELGVTPVMITGDSGKTARAIAQKAGIDAVFSQVLPFEKSAWIERLKAFGHTAMVGDGINDAIALTIADTGVAIGSGSDVAVDSGDVVLMKSSLKDVAAAIRLSRATLRNIKQNLFWAFFYNLIGIPLAAGVFIPLFSWTLTPMFGAAAMSLSSFFVVSNALRLNLFDPKKRKKKQKQPLALPEELFEKNEMKGEILMKTTTVHVEGMMCPMCEKHVCEAIQTHLDVNSVVASHEKKTVVIQSEKALSKEALFDAVKEAGYTPLSVDAD